MPLFTSSPSKPTLERLPSGIPGLDHLTGGGLPKGRVAMICGTSGSGKTVFASQFLASGIEQYDHGGVFIAFEETPIDIRKNMTSFGWDIEQWEKDEKWRFVDAGLRPQEEEFLIDGEFNLEALRTRIAHAVEQTKAERVAVDSLAAVFTRFREPGMVRRELFLIVEMLRDLGVTAVLTTELIQASGDTTRFEVEEYVADTVVILRNRMDHIRRRRTLEIMKLRGGSHQSGQHAMSITERGISAVSIGSYALDQPSTKQRIPSGNETLDEMCGGGFYQDSVTIISGATGTGKTLTAMQFLAGGGANGEKCLLISYEESRAQLIRNANAWGIDLEAMEKNGQLLIECAFPESISLEQHLDKIRLYLEEFQPDRIVVDSITAMERVTELEYYQEFVLSLTSLIKQRQVAGLYTSTTDHLSNVSSVTEKNISTLSDAIILLRYVESEGQIARSITVLKMRGSFHDKTIRRFEITKEGLQIGEAFLRQSGVLGGLRL